LGIILVPGRIIVKAVPTTILPQPRPDPTPASGKKEKFFMGILTTDRTRETIEEPARRRSRAAIK
jgi:hypothetical protein